MVRQIGGKCCGDRRKVVEGQEGLKGGRAFYANILARRDLRYIEGTSRKGIPGKRNSKCKALRQGFGSYMKESKG